MELACGVPVALLCAIVALLRSMTDLWIYLGFVLAVIVVTAIHIRIRDMEDDDR